MKWKKGLLPPLLTPLGPLGIPLLGFVKISIFKRSLGSMKILVPTLKEEATTPSTNLTEKSYNNLLKIMVNQLT